MTLSQQIIEIIKKSKTIAVVGISRNSEKASNYVPKYLQDQGFKIIPVNPFASEILGEKAYPTLQSIPDKIDIIQIFRPSDETPAIVQEAVKLKPKLIWLQLSIESVKAQAIALRNDIPIVMDHCLKIEHMKLKENNLL